MKEVLYNDDEYLQVTEDGEAFYDEGLAESVYGWMRQTLSEMYRGKKVKIEAELGLWDGKRKASAIADDFEEAFEKCLLNCEQHVKVIKTGAHSVRVTIAHHDGTNNYVLRDY